MIRYRKNVTIETLVCATILVMALVEDYASVSYYSKETYFYLMIGMLTVEKLRKEYQKQIPQIQTLQEEIVKAT